MKHILALSVAIIVLNSCAMMTDLVFSETIGGVKIVSIEDIENKEGIFIHEIRGTMDSPFETDEEWFLAFQAIYSQKKVAGMNTTIQIYVDQDNWEIGTPYAVAKYKDKKQASIIIDGRLIKIK